MLRATVMRDPLRAALQPVVPFEELRCPQAHAKIPVEPGAR